MRLKHILLSAIAAATLMACGTPQRPAHSEPANAVYYWKTVFSLSDADRHFLEANDIRRMYVRFFDVVCADTELNGFEEIVPSATIRFKDTVPPVDIVPTVYITLDALRAMKDEEARWAGIIAGRVLNMCSYNGIDSVAEVQLDCDWTATTQQSFFDLCRAFGDSLRVRRPDIHTGATIRLHQLALEAPPVDAGVLMVYNTGSFRDPLARNSIIDLDDIEPYLRRTHSYSLPLDFAYPAYSWGLVFRDGSFKCLLRDVSVLSDTTLFAVDGNHAVVKKDCLKENIGLHEGDRIRIETSSFDEIARVKHAVESRLAPASGNYSTIIYHLDSLNLSKYTDDELHQIYRRGN